MPFDNAPIEKTIIDQIKERYPKPISVREPDKDLHSYCVLGAVTAYVRPDSVCALGMFPDPVRAGDVLRQANPNLSETLAYSYAARISTANDGYDFDEAWSLLSNALNYGS